MGLLKTTLMDKYINKDKYNKIMLITSIREQKLKMIKSFEGVSIVERIINYSEENKLIHKFMLFALDEEKMVSDLGYDAVIERLTSDRDKLFTILKNVKEVNLSEISSMIREEKVNRILQ